MKQLALVLSLLTPAVLAENDRGMFGNTPSRNMVSPAQGLPSTWDPDSGQNVKWTADLGSETYGGPVVAGGMVFVGTNNEGRRDESIVGDRGVVMAFRAADGEFLWQAVHEKRTEGRDVDWPLQGVCSTPLVDGDRVYYVSNRGELVALDAQGFRDGENDGPFTSEARSSDKDADVVWTLDLIGKLGVIPHNMSLSSPLAVGDLILAGTSNGIDGRHAEVPSPAAPSFIAVHRETGKLAWKDSSPGAEILDGQWSNPAAGEIAGQMQVIFAGGDGWIYSFKPADGSLLWKFDANRHLTEKDGEPAHRNNIIATPVVHDDKVYIGIGNDPEVGEGPGRLWVIDGSLRGDITKTGVIWSRGGDDFRMTLSTVAIHKGLIYASDLSGFLYCLDAETGKHHWTYDAFAAVWGSPFVADEKVYLADEDGDVVVLKTGTTLEELAEINMGNSVLTTPAAIDGVLFIATREKLFAIAE